MARRAPTPGASFTLEPEPAAARNHDPVHPFLVRTFGLLDDAGAVWAVLRGEDALADPDGDVDLLIRPEDLAPVRRKLGEAGFVEERSWGSSGHRPFLGYDSDTDRWFKLDIVTRLTFGAAGTVRAPAAAVLPRRSRIGSVHVLDPQDRFWALLLHAVLDKGVVASKHRDRLVAGAAEAFRGRAPGPIGDAVRRAHPASDLQAMAGAAARADWAALERTGAALRGNGPAVHATAVARSLVRKAGWRLGLIRGGGVGVALLGPDGAGKSTLSEAIRDAFPVEVRTIYMGLYKKQLRLPPGVGLAARAALQRVRYTRGMYGRARGRVVVFDRYTHDALVQQHARTGIKTRVHRFMLAHAAPAPDLLIVLDLSGPELFARKGERAPETLEAMRAGYRALATQPGCVMVDAGGDFETERRQTIDLIWKSLARRQLRRGRRSRS